MRHALARRLIFILPALALGVNGNATTSPRRTRSVSDANSTVLDGAAIQLPACAQTCQDQFAATFCSNVSENAAPSECCSTDDNLGHGLFNSELATCTQASCSLSDHLAWQAGRAAACDIKPRDVGSTEISLSWGLFSIGSLFLVGRFLARSKTLAGPGYWWDDWTVLIVWIISLELTVCLPFMRRNHTGIDNFAATADDARRFLMWLFVSEPFYLLSVYGTKLSMVILYMRVWEATTGFRKLCWISVYTLFFVPILFAVLGLALLWPFHYYVGDSAIVVKERAGFNIFACVMIVGVLNVVLDFWVLLLPISKLITLRGLSRSRKIGMSIVLLLGFITTTASIIRVRYIVPLRNSTNITWDFGHFGMWSVIEVHLSMITCNIPVIIGLFVRLRARPPRLESGDHHHDDTFRGISSGTDGSSMGLEEVSSSSDVDLCGGDRRTYATNAVHAKGPARVTIDPY